MLSKNTNPQVQKKRYRIAFGLTEEEASWLWSLVQNAEWDDYPKEAKQFFTEIKERLKR